MINKQSINYLKRFFVIILIFGSCKKKELPEVRNNLKKEIQKDIHHIKTEDDLMGLFSSAVKINDKKLKSLKKKLSYLLEVSKDENIDLESILKNIHIKKRDKFLQSINSTAVNSDTIYKKMSAGKANKKFNIFNDIVKRTIFSKIISIFYLLILLNIFNYIF